MSQRDMARSLRNNGLSFREVAHKLNIPLSTAFLWTKDIELGSDTKTRLKNRAIETLQIHRYKAQQFKKEKYLEEVKKNREIGKNLIKNLNLNLVAAALYWGEGFKKDSGLGLANSDPKMIKLFIYWLVNYMMVPKENIRLRIGINEYFKDKIKSIQGYWSKYLNIPQNQFQKPFFQKQKLQRLYDNKDSYYGVLRVRTIGQNAIYRQLLGMVEKLQEESERVQI